LVSGEHTGHVRKKKKCSTVTEDGVDGESPMVTGDTDSLLNPLNDSDIIVSESSIPSSSTSAHALSSSSSPPDSGIEIPAKRRRESLQASAEKAENFWKSYVAENNTVIAKTFQGVYKSTVSLTQAAGTGTLCFQVSKEEYVLN
jgi:hypothetical protein